MRRAIKYWKRPPRTLAISISFNNLLVRDSLRHNWPHWMDETSSNNAFQSHFVQFERCLYSSEYQHVQRRGSRSPPPPALWNTEEKKKLLFNPRANYGLIRKHHGVHTHCWQPSKYPFTVFFTSNRFQSQPSAERLCPWCPTTAALKISVIPGQRNPLSPRLLQCNSDTQWQVLH